MGISQKDAVVAEVKKMLPIFALYKDIALLALSSGQLEQIKNNIQYGILNGTIDYGKDVTNKGEVIPYARSMVMNHLKKAKELNGGQAYGGSSTPRTPKAQSEEKALESINSTLLTTELQSFVKDLV